VEELTPHRSSKSTLVHVSKICAPIGMAKCDGLTRPPVSGHSSRTCSAALFSQGIQIRDKKQAQSSPRALQRRLGRYRLLDGESFLPVHGHLCDQSRPGRRIDDMGRVVTPEVECDTMESSVDSPRQKRSDIAGTDSCVRAESDMIASSSCQYCNGGFRATSCPSCLEPTVR